jgi:protein TonB
MSPASLAVSRATHIHPHVHPDPARIAAISVAIALNLAVVLIASRPLGPAQLSLVHELSPVPTIRLIEAAAVFEAPPTIELKPLVHVPVLATPHPHAVPVTTPAVAPSSEGRIAVIPASAPNLAPAGAVADVVNPTPTEASLAYRSAPLHFPIQALRQHMHGTVLLRVLVDENGKPLQVSVVQGSGYALLDRSAREQVLTAWRFQPAMLNGHAVRAWANVPVSFALSE